MFGAGVLLTPGRDVFQFALGGGVVTTLGGSPFWEDRPRYLSVAGYGSMRVYRDRSAKYGGEPSQPHDTWPHAASGTDCVNDPGHPAAL